MLRYRFAAACLSTPIVPIVVALAVRECVQGIYSTTRRGTAGGGRTLGVAGELAIAGIPPDPSLQAVAILQPLCRRRDCRSDCSQSGNSREDGERRAAR